MKSVLIIASILGYNRQGHDLANVLRSNGCRVKLVHYANSSEPEIGNYGVKFIRPHGLFSKFHVCRNILGFALKTIGGQYDSIVCIGSLMLPLAALLKKFYRSDLVYYSLEYIRYGKLCKFIMQKSVDRYIDVEESRQRRVFYDLKINVPYLVVYNMPQLSCADYNRGGLRRFLLKEKCISDANVKIVIYAGSYQRYACIENIIDASKQFRKGIILVLMLAGKVPKDLKLDSENSILVPTQAGDEFFHWIADADGALLPYESSADFNVQNCSPQKLFDCYRVGVPYLASRRPLIEKVLAKCPESGCFCDYTNIESIVKGVEKLVVLKTNALTNKMIDLYRNEYNYSKYGPVLANFV